MKETLPARSQHALFPLKTHAKINQNIARAVIIHFCRRAAMRCEAMPTAAAAAPAPAAGQAAAQAAPAGGQAARAARAAQRASRASSTSSVSTFAAGAGAAACALLFWCLCCFCVLCCLSCSQNHRNRKRSKRNRSQNKAKTRLEGVSPPTKALLDLKIARFDLNCVLCGGRQSTCDFNKTLRTCSHNTLSL